jgi:hypothetical protein
VWFLVVDSTIVAKPPLANLTKILPSSAGQLCIFINCSPRFFIPEKNRGFKQNHPIFK